MEIRVPNQENADEDEESVLQQHISSRDLLQAGESFVNTAAMIENIPIPELDIDESLRAAEVHCTEHAKWSNMFDWERTDIMSTYFCQLFVFNHRLADRIRLAKMLKALLDTENLKVPAVDELIDGRQGDVDILYGKEFYTTRQQKEGTGNRGTRGTRARGRGRK